MTPHPDTAHPNTSILDALKKMHGMTIVFSFENILHAYTNGTSQSSSLDGHYLNLPVLDEDKNIVGLVDVLKLTYATLEQVRCCRLFLSAPESSVWRTEHFICICLPFIDQQY
jgi:hypothetical protein